MHAAYFEEAGLGRGEMAGAKGSFRYRGHVPRPGVGRLYFTRAPRKWSLRDEVGNLVHHVCVVDFPDALFAWLPT